MPLMELEPPSTLPLGMGILRPWVFDSGSVSKHQFTLGRSIICQNPPGMWMRGLQSRPPASSSSTELRESALNRFASTQPAEPAPTTM